MHEADHDGNLCGPFHRIWLSAVAEMQQLAGFVYFYGEMPASFQANERTLDEAIGRAAETLCYRVGNDTDMAVLGST